MAKASTATVSVCVTADEAQLIRDAASVAGLTVSTWGTTQVIKAMSGAVHRHRVAEVAERIEKNALPPGTRGNRVSMVMPLSNHASMKTAAEALGLTAHAFAQATLLDAADNALKGVQPGEILARDSERRARKTAATILVNVPEGTMDGVEVAKVSEVVRQLVVACSRNTLNGKGQGIADGAVKLTASRAGQPHVIARLTVPDFDLRAVAYVLEIPPETLATALTLKAVRILTQKAVTA